jgi:hypothetical protein
VLVGAELAHEAGLQEKLVTNEERFRGLCELLANEEVAACDRLARAEVLVDTIEQYRFVSERGLRLETLIGATRLATKTLLECDSGISPR